MPRYLGGARMQVSDEAHRTPGAQLSAWIGPARSRGNPEQNRAQVSEFEGREAPIAGSESGDRPEKVPITARLLLNESLTCAPGRRDRSRRSPWLITVAGGILERVVDHQEFPTIGRGLWFALQTVTTVGYGDVTPKQADGRFIVRS